MADLKRDFECPHCVRSIHVDPHDTAVDFHPHRATIAIAACPSCARPIAWVRVDNLANAAVAYGGWKQAYPKGSTRPAAPEQVPPEIAEDYTEACLVADDSPKAAAALARRCLQHVLTTAGGATGRDLSQQIDRVMPSLSPTLAGSIDAIRHLGNFAAHPMKSTDSGLILEVEPGEVEWSLDTLLLVFDHYYVQPAVLAQRRADMNAKLADAGKPLLKDAAP